MINGMYLSTMGAMAQISRHQAIANNMANANTKGYKPDVVVMREVPAESVRQGSIRREIDSMLEKTGGGVWVSEVATKHIPGAAVNTGNEFDAMLNDGTLEEKLFFMVKESVDSEEIKLTRNGSFLRGTDGNLRMASGQLVLDPSGNPIQIPAGIRPAIEEDGRIMDKSQTPPAQVGQIGVMSTTEPEKMLKAGNNMFVANNAEMTNAQYGVQGGFLEASSANGITEMMNMIEGHRTYETNMKFLTIQDETLGSVVSRLGSLA